MALRRGGPVSPRRGAGRPAPRRSRPWGTRSVSPSMAVSIAVKIWLRTTANMPEVTSPVRSVVSTPIRQEVPTRLGSQHAGEAGDGHYQTRPRHDREQGCGGRSAGEGQGRARGAEREGGGEEDPARPLDRSGRAAQAAEPGWSRCGGGASRTAHRTRPPGRPGTRSVAWRRRRQWSRGLRGIVQGWVLQAEGAALEEDDDAEADEDQREEDVFPAFEDFGDGPAGGDVLGGEHEEAD